MQCLAWSPIFEMEHTIGYRSNTTGDLWFVHAQKQQKSDYDAYGVNHISLRVDFAKDIDTIAKFVTEQGIELLFDTPKHRPEFSPSESETYYQIMFKTADNILFEVVYIGKKE